MNDVQCLIDRQLGIYSRLTYDNVLKRLLVREEESYYGLAAAGAEDPPIFACRFAESSGLEQILALANEDGRVAIQDITKTDAGNSLEGFLCHNNAVFDLAWMPGSMNFVTVSGDHTACLWDVAEGPPKKILAFQSHTRSVKTAVFRPTEPSVFATGARDGHILIWDIRTSSQPSIVVKPDNCLMNCHSNFTPKTPGSHSKRARIDTHRATSITGLVFQDDITLISCGECDGNIKVWDLRKNYSNYTREPLPKHSIPYCGSSTKNGYTSLIVDDARVRLYASCMDNVIYCFNVSTYNALPERRYIGHENGTFYIKTGLSPDCRYLVSGSSDKHAYIWNVQRSQPVVRLTGHRAEVTCAAWARGASPRLVTCSDDARHKIWRVGHEGPGDARAEGRAEPVPRREPAQLPRWQLKRRAGSPPPDTKRPHQQPRRTKRCLAELLNSAREPDDDAPKRARPDTPPRGCKRTRDGADDADCDAPAFLTPTKRRARRSSEAARSPAKTPPSVRVRSPTRDLPDFVRTGEAPHLRLMSPAKRKLDAPDWLTALKRDRRERAAPYPAPLSPLSPCQEPPPRRGSVSERTPKSGRRTNTLLRYFRISNKEN